MPAPTIAAADEIPLPRPRPAAIASSASPEPSACQLELAKRAVFAPLPPIIGSGGCGAPDVVRLDAVIMPDQTHVSLQPPPTLRCRMGGAGADWGGGGLGPPGAP